MPVAISMPAPPTLAAGPSTVKIAAPMAVPAPSMIRSISLTPRFRLAAGGLAASLIRRLPPAGSPRRAPGVGLAGDPHPLVAVQGLTVEREGRGLALETGAKGVFAGRKEFAVDDDPLPARGLARPQFLRQERLPGGMVETHAFLPALEDRLQGVLQPAFAAAPATDLRVDVGEVEGAAAVGDVADVLVAEA